MDIRVYSIIFASVLAFSTVSSENIQCPQCMHMGYTFTNMPSMYKSIIGGVLASLNLSNPACQFNTLLPDPCPAPGAGNRSKCETFVFKTIGVGFSTILPTAGMAVDVVSRSCAERPVAEADMCMDVDDMSATNPELGAALARMTSRLNTVNYTGEQCFTSANGSETITPEPHVTEVPNTTQILTTGSSLAASTTAAPVAANTTTVPVAASTTAGPVAASTTAAPEPTAVTMSTDAHGCSECFHIGVQTKNMPAFATQMMTTILNSMNLTNRACANNTVPPSTCSAAFPGTINKCHDVASNVHAVGMTGVIPDAEVHMDVIVRGCEAVPLAEAADGCSPVQKAFDAASMSQVMTSIKQMSDRFDKVTYNGTSCLFPVGSKAPTVEPTTIRTTTTIPTTTTITTKATPTEQTTDGQIKKNNGTSDGNGSSQISLSFVCLMLMYILHL